MKDKKLFLPVLTLVIVAVPVYIIVFEAFDNWVSAVGAGMFSGLIVSYLLFSKRWSVFDKEAAEKRAATLEAKLDAIPKIESPCEVSIFRPASLIGGMMSVVIYLHDEKIGELKNGKTFNFSTPYATNNMKLIYQADGTKIEESFSAEPGGSLRYQLNYSQGVLIEY